MARPAALALALVALAAGAPAAWAGWGAPFRFAAPGSSDTLPAQIGYSSSGAAAVAFGVQDADNPATSAAQVTVRTAQRRVGTPKLIPGAQQVLGLSFDGSSLELLTGTSPAGEACCSSAQAVSLNARGAFGAPRTLVGGLAGATLGALLTLPDGRMLAAVATGLGVWVVQSVSANRFAGPHKLTSPAVSPESLVATNLGGNNTAVAWTAVSGSPGEAVARSIFLATGSAHSAPRRARTALTVPAGHGIDELGIAPGSSSPTAAWIESWYDRRGGYHAQVRAADLTAHPGARTLSPSGQLASGLAFAGDAAGDLAAAWKTCTSSGACTLYASVRRVGQRFGSPQSLGSIDPSQTPAATVSPGGDALVGWVRSGQPVAAERAHGAARFGADHVLSRTVYAADLAISFGPAHEAIAAWTQGTLAPSVVGVAYRTP